MAAIEERVAFLEGRVGEHGHMIDGIREAIVSLERRMDARFEAVDRRFDAIDRRFETIDQRFAAIDQRFEAVDRRFETIERRFDGVDRRFAGVDHRIEGLDAKMSRQFMWLVGIQVTTLVAIVAALVAR